MQPDAAELLNILLTTQEVSVVPGDARTTSEAPPKRASDLIRWRREVGFEPATFGL